MNDKTIRLLLIEDDKVDQMAFGRFAGSETLPYDYTIAGSIAEAKEILESINFDLIIADYMLGDGTSFELFDLFKDLPVIVTTGTGNEEIAVEAMKLGACDYLIKDPEGNYLKTLPSTVELALKRKKTEKELRNYQERLESMVKERTAQLEAEIVERKLTEEALRVSESELRIRNRIANVFLFVPDDEMYDKILKIILEVLESKYGVFGYIDDNGYWVCPSMTRDIWEQCEIPGKDVVFPHDKFKGLWGKAIIEKKPFFSNESLKVPEGHIPITRALDVPILHQGEVIGNILVGNKQTDYSEKDQQLMETIVDFIAPVLEARLQRDSQERRRVQAEMEKEKMQQQLQQAQKLESIGTLAGGVAHEINNPINGIMNYAQLIMDRLDKDSPLAEYADEIIQETKRIANIVRNLLAFSRDEKQSHSPARIMDIIEETISLVRTIIRRDQITIEMDIPEDLPKIKCRSQQIQQVLMNLVINARDALNEKYPGYDENKIMKISTKLFKRNEKKWIRTIVEDHGSGISEEIRERIFDPFYTTKPKEIGTGLGLSISYGIIQEHHGELTVESESEKYTRFHLDLPVDNGWQLDGEQST